jgi:hypothetical protein
MKSLALLVLPWLGLIACTGESEAPTSEQGLSLSTYTDKLIVGAYDDNVIHVDLESREISDGVVVTTVTVDQLVFTLTVDYGSSEINLANPSASPNREQIAALHALENELAFMTTEDKSMTDVESTLVGLGTLLSDALAGEVLPSIQTTMNRLSTENIGASNTCRTLYGGSCSPYKQTGRDSDNCKGRCGAGCGSAHSGGNNKWTMDCAEHDYGIGPFGDCVNDAVDGANYYTSGGSCFFAGNCNSSDGCSSSAGGHGSSCRN